MAEYKVGKTYKVEVEFYDFNGQKVTPDNPFLKLFDGYGKELDGENLTPKSGEPETFTAEIKFPDKRNPLTLEAWGTLPGKESESFGEAKIIVRR